MFGRAKIEKCVPRRPLPELVQRTRIVVIDDVKTEFPFQVLGDAGYSIDYWADVQDLNKLESGFYDIIVLDIGGVGGELDQENEGVGVLRHLKTVNPSQIVVAHSGLSHKSERIPFFRLADQYVPKPTSAITWKEILDDLVSSRLTVSHFWEALRAVMLSKGASKKQIRKVEAQLLKTSRRQAGDFEPRVRRILAGVQDITTILRLAGRLAAICAS